MAAFFLVILLKYIQKTERWIFQVQKYTEEKYINDLFNLFPYYDFGENYRENDQNDFL